MKNKKIAILGRGTAGAVSAALLYKREGFDVDWIYDSNIKTQAVGEGSILNLPKILYKSLGFTFDDLKSVDGTFKIGLKKDGWGKTGKTFFHYFSAGEYGYHFNALKLQDFISNRVSDTINLCDRNIKSYDDIDADHIIDCGGRRPIDDTYITSEYMPINSAYVTQCYWDSPKFNYTLAIARPYGWVFGVPLNNRCSIGYMYNNTINSLDEVKEDVKNIFDEYNLIPSEHTNSISFPNYYKKQNYTSRVSYNGNASFFLEPLEATSISFMADITARSMWITNKSLSVDLANRFYNTRVKEIENVIMIHYFAGSKYKTEFWEKAKELGNKNMKDTFAYFSHAISYSLDEAFKINSTEFINANHNPIPTGPLSKETLEGYGTWSPGSFNLNLHALDIVDELKLLYTK